MARLEAGEVAGRGLSALQRLFLPGLCVFPKTWPSWWVTRDQLTFEVGAVPEALEVSSVISLRQCNHGRVMQTVSQRYSFLRMLSHLPCLVWTYQTFSLFHSVLTCVNNRTQVCNRQLNWSGKNCRSRSTSK